MFGGEADTAMNYPPILIGFSTSTGWLARGIRWFTRGSVSHTFIAYKDIPLGCWMILGANDNGVTGQVADTFKPTVVELFAPVDVDLWMGLRAVKQRLNEKYNYPALLGMSIVEVGRFFHQHWPNPWSDDNSDFCSEFAARVCAGCFPADDDFHKKLALLQGFSAVSPEDLLEMLRATPHMRSIGAKIPD